MDRPAIGQDRRVELDRSAPFRVGHATIDPVAHEARYKASVERLQPQLIKVLIALHDGRGSVVTRQELIDRCWDGRIVTDAVINRAILLLRGLAGRAGGFRVETIPKSGYRLIEGVEPWHRRRWVVIAAGCALLAAVGVAIAAYNRIEVADQVTHSVALVPFTAGPDPESRNLAVASGNVLADMLAQGSFPPNLHWPATRKAMTTDDFIMTGDIRKVGNSFTAVVKLRDRRSNTVMFTRRYQAGPSEAADLPERIGAEMSSNLGGALALLVLNERRPASPSLRADMLRHIALIVANEDPLSSYAISRRMAENEPASPLSQIAFAFDSGFSLGSLPRSQRPDALRKGREAAANAVRLAGDFGDSYAPWCFLHPAPRASECEDRLRAGLKVDPDAPFAAAFLSDVLRDVGRYDEALRLARSALADQPFHPQKITRVLLLLIVNGDMQFAERLFEQSKRWWPAHPSIHWNHVMGYALRGDLAGADRAIAQVPATAGLDLESAREVTTAWARGSAESVKSRCQRVGEDYMAQILCLSALRQAGDKDLAIEIADKLSPRLMTGSLEDDENLWLDRPYQGLEPVFSAPASKWLRSDPRYRAMVERMGLGAYWRSGRRPDFCIREREPVCRQLDKRTDVH